MPVPVPGEKATMGTQNIVPLNTSTNSMTDSNELPNSGSSVVDNGKGSKKWKTHEEANTHLVLPDGSCHAQKLCCRN